MNYFGLLRLAQEFAPALKSRAADGATRAIAWVNVLSIFALSNYPPHGTYSASKAAAFSLVAGVARRTASGRSTRDQSVSRADRRRMGPTGAAAEAFAGRGGDAIVEALKGSVEDVYPGDVAKDWLARHLDNPKALEHELGEGGQ